MKKIYWVLIIIGILIVAWGFVRFVIGGSEDSWIKDEKGVWVKHGFPFETPDYVKEQQEALSCAFELYEAEKIKGIEFSSQCLGRCSDYAVDIVHIPRNEDDNKIENQCLDYRDKKVNHFIELDKEMNIVRVV